LFACPYKHKGVEFHTNLVLLNSEGIDVILGMDCLKRWEAMVECATGSVRMCAPSGEKVEVVLGRPPVIEGRIN
jgi:hypothetical protein